MEGPADTSLASWITPECPFTLEYVPRVLDDIRLAVVDAFFSLPHGGAEIGGILLGRAEEGRIVVTGAIPADCEHAFGPSFTLSEADQVRLGLKLAEAGRDANSRPVGWYHSHTRSEIFLSDADLEIHKRFFPEPWQVALVLKPHTFLPTRAGFFFRDRDGAIRADSTYREFQLDSLPLGKVPSDEPAAIPAPSPAPPAARVIDISSAAVPEPVAEPEPRPSAAAPIPAVAPPSFAMEEPAPSRSWLAPVAILAGLAVGAAGFLARQHWMSRPAAVPSAGIVTQAALGLTTADQDGKLQIQWDAKSPDVQRSSGGLLLISDGAQPHTITLDSTQLKNGSMIYTRTSDRVNIILSLTEPGGDKLLQAAGFVKPPVSPAPPPAAEPAAAEQTLRNLHAEIAELKATNMRLTESNKRMERYVEADRAEHQRKRMGNQSVDGK
jgi:proteasome lid subunit RPN8/RPN11